ncbi:MAG: hypothetical protein AB4040_11960 [Synechococcus sp.]
MLTIHLLLAFTLVVSAMLWAYSTLMVFWVLLEESNSIYSTPMRSALDRFVDTFYLGWLKPLHQLHISERRPLSYGLFVAVTIGIGVLLYLSES